MLLTVKQVAQKLEISEQRVRQLIYQGRIKAVKIGPIHTVEEADAVYIRRREWPPPSWKLKEGREAKGDAASNQT